MIGSIIVLTVWPCFGPVRFSFVHGAVRTVLFFGSDGSSGFPLCFRTVLRGKARFRFRMQFLRNGSHSSGSRFGAWKRFQRFRFPVLVRFLRHPVLKLWRCRDRAKISSALFAQAISQYQGQSYEDIFGKEPKAFLRNP